MKQNYTKYNTLRLFFLVLLGSGLFYSPLNAQADTEHYFAPIYQGGDHANVNAVEQDRIANVSMYIANPNAEQANVTITYDGGSSITENIPAFESELIVQNFRDAFTVRENQSFSVLPNRAIKVTSNVPVQVSLRGNSGNQAFHVVSKGRNALGTEFRGGHLYQGRNNSGSTRQVLTANSIGIYAKEDNTTVHISINEAYEALSIDRATSATAPVPTAIGRVQGKPTASIITPSYGQPPGWVTYEVDLNADQTVTVIQTGEENDQDYNTLMGSRIRSVDASGNLDPTKPISVTVFSIGNQMVRDVDYNNIGRDYGADQIVPVDLIGTQYALSRAAPNDIFETATVVAHTNNTAIFINGNPQPLTVLNAGEYFHLSPYDIDALDGTIDDTYPNTSAGNPRIFDGNGDLIRYDNSIYTEFQNVFIETSNPAYVYQNIAGGTGEGAATSGMWYVPPLVCSAPRSGMVPLLDRAANLSLEPFINILTKSTASITINGQDLVGLIQSGDLLNYGESDITGSPVFGLNGFVTYKISGANGATNSTNQLFNNSVNGTSILVEANEDLYLAGYGASGPAGQGGYYAGFEPTIQISTDDDCYPITITGPEGYDEYRWFRNDGLIVGETSHILTVAESVAGVYEYELQVNFFGCDPLVSENTIIRTAVARPTFESNTVSYCTLDFDPIASGPTVLDVEAATVLGLPVTASPGETVANNVFWYRINPNVDPSATEVGKNELILSTLPTGAQDISLFAVYRPSPVNDPDSCNSATPLEIIVRITEPTALPEYVDPAITSALYCSNEAAIVGDLISANLVSPMTAESGNTIVYFSQDFAAGDTSLENTTPVSPTQLLETGTYWAASFNDGNCDYTNRLPIQVYVEGPLNFEANPSTPTICANEDVTLNATVRNTGASQEVINAALPGTSSSQIYYVWEYSLDNSVSWTDIPSGAIISQTDENQTTNLSTTAITLAEDFVEQNQIDAEVSSFNALYRVKAYLDDDGDLTTLSCPPTATSLSASITFTGFINGTGAAVPSINIITQPTDDQEACGGDIVTLTVEAGLPAAGTLQYEWQQREVNATQGPDDNWNTVGANRNLLVTATTSLNTQEFRVLLTTDDCTNDNATASNIVNIIVDGPITVTQDIQSAIVCSGTDAQFSVEVDTGVTGSTAVYEWFVDLASDDAGTDLGFIPVPASKISGPNNQATITITNISNLDNGDRFQVRVTTDQCTSPVSSTAFLRVEGPVTKSTITIPDDIDRDGDDKNALICNAGILTLNAIPDDTSYEGTPNYIWQESATGNFDTDGITVGTGQTLLLSNVQANKTGFQYRVLTGTDECPTEVASETITLTVAGPLFITQEIGNQVVCADEDLTLSVSVNAGVTFGTATNLVYRWTKQVSGSPSFVPVTYDETTGNNNNGTATPTNSTDPVEGASSTLSLTNAALNSNGNSTLYRAEVFSTVCSSPTSSTALVTLEGPLSFETVDGGVQPTFATEYCIGDAPILTAEAFNPNSGTVSYIWRRRANTSSPYQVLGSGSTFILPPVTVQDNGFLYSAVATTEVCTSEVVSDELTLNVLGEIDLITPLISPVRVCGDGTQDAVFTVDAQSTIPSDTLVYQWFENVTDVIVSGTNGYTISNGGKTLTLDSSFLTNNAKDGTFISVSITNGSCPSVSNSTTLVVEGPVVPGTGFTSTEFSTCPGGSIDISATDVADVGSGSPTYQWQYRADNTQTFVDIPTQTNSSLSIVNVQNQDFGEYRVRVSTASCSSFVTSDIITLRSSSSIEINTDLQNVTVCATENGSNYETVSPVFTIATTGTDFLWLKNTGTGGFVPVTYGETVGGNNGGLATPTPDPTDQVNTGPSLHLLPVTESTASYGSGSGPIALANGTLYRVEVSSAGCSGSGLQSTAQLFVDGPLKFTPTGTPSSQTACDGGTVVFSAEALELEGSGQLDYFWEVDLASDNATSDAGFVPASGGTNPTLVISNVSGGQNGNRYRVTITGGIDTVDGGCGSLTYPDDFPGAPDVLLTVEGPITITQGLQDLVVCQEDANPVTATFTVNSTAGSGTQVYNWQRFNVATNSWDNINETETLGGNNGGDDFTSSGTLNLPVSASDDNSLYRVSITTGLCTVPVLSQARLDVEGPITVNSPTDLADETVVVCDGSSLILSVDADIAAGNITYLWEESEPDGTAFRTVGIAPSFTKSGINASLDNGRTYRVTIGSSEGFCTPTVKNYNLVVDGPLVITDQIQPVTVCDDADTTTDETFSYAITVTAGNNGSTPEFSWFYNNTAIANGDTQSGITYTTTVTPDPTTVPAGSEITSTLTLTGSIDAATFDGLNFRVEVGTLLPNGDVGSCPRISSTTTLNVDGPVENLIVESQNHTPEPNVAGEQQVSVCADEVVVLAASTDNTQAISYLWETSETPDFETSTTVNIVQTGPVYTFQATPRPVDLYYRVRASVNASCFAVSEPIKVVIDGPVAILNPIDNVTICDTQDVTFTVEASTTNGNLQFAWFEVDTSDVETPITPTANVFEIVSTATQSTLTVINADASFNGLRYRVKVTTDIKTPSGDDICEAVSSTATLSLGGVNGALTITPKNADDEVIGCANDILILSVDGTITDQLGNPITDFLWQSSDIEDFDDPSATVRTVGSGFTFTLNNIDTALNGTYYRVLASAGVCGNIPSSPVQLVVDGPVELQQEVVDVNLCDEGDLANQQAVFTVEATAGVNSQAIFEWKDDTGAPIANTTSVTEIVTTGTLGGTYTSTLTIYNVDASFNGLDYTVEVTTDLGSCSIVRSAATLNVQGPISNLDITGTPDIQFDTTDNVSFIEVCVGGIVNLEVNASSNTGEIVNYVWQTSNNEAFSDDTSTNPDNFVRSLGVGASFNIVNASSAIQGNYYRVVASTALCSIPSDPIQIRLDGPITFEQTPIDEELCDDGITDGTTADVVLTARARTENGGNLIYSWYVITVSGDRLRIADDGKLFRDDNGTEVEVIGGDGIIYQPAVLGTQSELSLIDVTSANNGQQYFVSVTTGTGACTPVESSRSQLTVEGPVTPAVISSNPVAVDENPDPTVIDNVITVCAGSTISFDADSTNTATSGVQFVWQYNTDPTFPDASTVTVSVGQLYTLSNVNTTIDGRYYRVITSTATIDGCEVASDPIRIRVERNIELLQELNDVQFCDINDPNNQQAQFTATFAADNGSAPVVVWEDNDGNAISDGSVGGLTYAITTTAVVNGEFSSTLTITGVTYANSNNNQYTAIANTASGNCDAITTSARLRISGPIDVTLTPTPSDTDADSDIDVCVGEQVVFRASGSTPSGTPISYVWESAEASDPTFSNPSIVFAGPVFSFTVTAADQGRYYRVVASSGSCFDTPSTALQLDVDGAIAITRTLEQATICDDGSGSTTHIFTTEATSDNGNLQFVWLRDGVDVTTLPNAADYTIATTLGVSTLTLNNVTSADDGITYTVQVATDKGFCAPLESSASLAISGPITVNELPESQAVCVGSVAQFNVDATMPNNGIINYLWQRSVSGDFDLDAVTVGFQPTYFIPNVQLAQDGYMYRVILSSGSCEVITTPVSLDVTPVLTIDVDPEDQIVEVGTDTAIRPVINGLEGNNTLQWQVNESNGAGWIDITDDAFYSGANTSSLQITNTPFSFTNNRYRLIIVSQSCGVTLTTDSMTLIADYNCTPGGDTLLNFQDPDDDGDGILDFVENSGFDVFGDEDGDNIRNFEDSDYSQFVDNDGNGVSDQFDVDGDGIVNQCDTDADGNGILDTIESGGLLSNPVDSDNDGVDDYLDLDNDNNGITDINEGTADTDGDGVPDYNDPDNDGDGITDIYEIGLDPSVPLDTDGDRTPDYLDTDSDNDGLSDAYEAGEEEFPIDTDEDGNEDYRDTDSDDNGITDTQESGGDETDVIDTDNNGTPDHLDFDNDGDSLDDAYELELITYDDTDGNFVSNTDNTDGLPIFTDSDDDGTPNYMDEDDDGDGILTIAEDGNENGFLLDTPEDDCDRNGILDYLDADSICDDLALPNGFTPNGDNLHESFVIPFLYDYPNYSIAIVDRYGNLVYEYQEDGDTTKDFEWWNGTRMNNGGDVLPAATYFYTIRFNKSQRPPKTGWVYLRK